MLKAVAAVSTALFVLTACQANQPASTTSSAPTPASWGTNALPDAQFVGFAQTVNDFELQSGQLALSKSSNQAVRSYANRAVADYTTDAQMLSRNRSEAGVAYAPDDNVKAIADDAMRRLNTLQGRDFDAAYADAQVRLQTAAVNQFGAYGGNSNASGPLRRYAQQMLPKSQSSLEFARRLSGGV